jgi:aspartate/methionine/tyrosine aminotransferase
MPDFVLERFFDRFEFSLPHQLGSSDPETLTLPELLRHADPEMHRRWDTLRLGYRTSAGDPDLRTAIAALYPGRTADDVVVAVGADEALLVTFAAAIEPGDRAVALTPAYQSLHEVPRAMGARLALVEVREDGPGGAWRLPMDRLMEALTPDVRLLVLDLPHNPTGVAATADELRVIVARCDRLESASSATRCTAGSKWTGATPPR